MGDGKRARQSQGKSPAQRGNQEMEKGQAWSMDLIVGVLIFLLAVGVIFSLLSNKSRQDITPLRIESEVIASKLAKDPSLRVATNNQLDPDRLAALTQMDYEELRAKLGVKNDFCIFLQDDAGNLTYIVDPNDATKKYTGIGSGKDELVLSGTPCGKIVP